MRDSKVRQRQARGGVVPIRPRVDWITSIRAPLGLLRESFEKGEKNQQLVCQKTDRTNRADEKFVNHAGMFGVDRGKSLHNDELGERPNSVPSRLKNNQKKGGCEVASFESRGPLEIWGMVTGTERGAMFKKGEKRPENSNRKEGPRVMRASVGPGAARPCLRGGPKSSQVEAPQRRGKKENHRGGAPQMRTSKGTKAPRPTNARG